MYIRFATGCDDIAIDDEADDDGNDENDTERTLVILIWNLIRFIKWRNARKIGNAIKTYMKSNMKEKCFKEL